MYSRLESVALLPVVTRCLSWRCRRSTSMGRRLSSARGIVAMSEVFVLVSGAAVRVRFGVGPEVSCDACCLRVRVRGIVEYVLCITKAWVSVM